MTNGQARLPVSDLEEVRYLFQGHSIPCPLCHLGNAIARVPYGSGGGGGPSRN